MVAKIKVLKLGDFWLPSIENKLKYIFNKIADINIESDEINIGEPDYVIGSYIEEYSQNKLTTCLTQIKDRSENKPILIVGITNVSIEKNLFSYVDFNEEISVISIKDIEEFGIDLIQYLLLGIVEHYIILNDNHDWHRIPKRCIFDYCGNKTDILNSSKYNSVCTNCEKQLSGLSKKLIEKFKFAIKNNYMVMNKDKLSIFISYSHRDEEIKNRIDVHLASLRRSEKVETWNDRKIAPGTEWNEKIKKELNEADVILLLISADFIASDYIWNIEIKKAIERHEKKEAIVIPIFCKSCDFKDMPFAKLQGLPKDAKPLSSFVDLDAGLTDVAKGIRKVVDEIVN